MVFIGAQLLRSVKAARAASVERHATISDLNPLNQRVRKSTTRIWIRIGYVDSMGETKSALAYARINSSMGVGDSVVALFAKGKASATIEDWQDWGSGVSCTVIGAWMLALGVFLRNLLDSDPALKKKPKSRKAKLPRNSEIEVEG
jgi:hypothetical protein